MKINALKQALAQVGIQADVVGVKAESLVPEGPMDDETLQGAQNRAQHARALVPDGDFYLAIENGLFTQPDGRYVDKAVVVMISKDGRDSVAYSEPTEFPKEAVEEARKRGFDTTTVGQVLAEQGLVAQHDDPHLSLVGKSRTTILTETIAGLLAQQLKWTGNAVDISRPAPLQFSGP